METMIAELDGIYSAIDRELAEYSRKANDRDRTVNASAHKHMANVDELRAKAHAITARLCGK